jgi:hypothetical protein
LKPHARLNSRSSSRAVRAPLALDGDRSGTDILPGVERSGENAALRAVQRTPPNIGANGVSAEAPQVARRFPLC